MLKTKKIIAIFGLFCLMVTTYGFGFTSIANAASLTNASDLLSSSDLSAVATHTVSFVTHSVTAASEYFTVSLPGDFSTTAASDAICPTDYVASNQTTLTIRCTASTSIAAGTTTVTLIGERNPAAAGSQTITIGTYTAGATLKESAGVMVAIIQGVTMTASVPSTLTFSISPVATGTVVNTATTTGASATTSVAFGSLVAGSSSVLAQQLNVTTNADYGFKVTVQQNQDLTSAAGSVISPFNNGVASTTAQAWVGPSGTLATPATWGHLAVTSDDTDISALQFSGATPYKGFIGTNPMEVMYHAGPSDGSTQNVGLAKVAFRLQISPIQPAGDYTNTLVYTATPTY